MASFPLAHDPTRRIINVHWNTQGLVVQWAYPLTITTGSTASGDFCTPVDIVATGVLTKSCQIFFGLNAPVITPSPMPPGYSVAGSPSVSPSSFTWPDVTYATPSFGGELLQPTQEPDPLFAAYGPAQSYSSTATSFSVKLFASTLNGAGVACYLPAPPSDPDPLEAVGFFVDQGQIETINIDVSGVSATLNGNPMTLHHTEVNAARRTAMLVAMIFRP